MINIKNYLFAHDCHCLSLGLNHIIVRQDVIFYHKNVRNVQVILLCFVYQVNGIG